MKERRMLVSSPMLCVIGALAIAISTASAASRDLPLLPPGSHLSIIVGFEQLPSPIQAKVDDYIAAAIAKGMEVGRVHSDWDALEPTPHEFQQAAIKNELEQMKKLGLKPMLTVSTMDTDELTMPPDLMDPDDQRKMAEGMPFDDPKVIQRFKAVCDWVVPMLSENGGWLFSIANEPNTLFGDHPEYASQLAAFVAAIRDHVHQINPDMAVTVTMADGFTPETAERAKPIIQECDVACFNYYPLDFSRGLEVQSTFDVHSVIDAMIKAAEGKEVIIQEVGCPAGYEDKPSGMKASLEQQRLFIQKMAAEMNAQPRLRAAFVFQLVDWSPQLTDMFTKVILGEMDASNPFAKNFQEWNLTTGLVRLKDGTPRPAWNAFLDGIALLARSRGGNQ